MSHSVGNSRAGSVSGRSASQRGSRVGGSSRKGGSESDDLDNSQDAGSDDDNATSKKKPFVAWRRLQPSNSQARPSNRTGAKAVVIPRSEVSSIGFGDTNIIMMGGECNPFRRSSEIEVLTVDSSRLGLQNAPPSAEPEVDKASEPRKTAVGAKDLERSLSDVARSQASSPEVQESQADVSVADDISVRTPGSIPGDCSDSETSLAKNEHNRFQEHFAWLPPCGELPGRPLRGCTMVSVGNGLLALFGGVQAEGGGAATNTMKTKNQEPSGSLHIFDVKQRRWLSIGVVRLTSRGHNNRQGSKRIGMNQQEIEAEMNAKTEEENSLRQNDVRIEGDPPKPRYEHVAVGLTTGCGRMVIHGGRGRRPRPMESIHILDVRGKSLRWRRVETVRGGGKLLEDGGAAQMGQSVLAQARQKQFYRRAHTACIFAESPTSLTMALFAGRTEGGEEGRLTNDLMLVQINLVESTYSIAASTAYGSAPLARAYHCAVMLGQFMVVFGGVSRRTTPFDDLYVLHLSSMVWARIGSPRPGGICSVLWPRARGGHVMVPLLRPASRGGDAILVFGGTSTDGQFLSDTFLLEFQGGIAKLGHSNASEDGVHNERDVSAYSALAAYPSAVVLSLWERLNANVSALQADQLKALSKRQEESEALYERLNARELAQRKEESAADQARKSLEMARAAEAKAESTLRQIYDRQRIQEDEARAAIKQAEAKATYLRRRLQRLQLTSEILGQTDEIPCDDLAFHPADAGAVIQYTLYEASKSSLAKTLRRVGTMCGSPVTIETFLLMSDKKPDSIEFDTTIDNEHVYRELKVMRRLRHPYLVQFYGIGFGPKDELHAVTEPPLIPLISEIQSHSVAKPCEWVSRSDGVRSALFDVAVALEYLHCNGVVHYGLSIEHVFVGDTRDSHRSRHAKLGGLVTTRLFQRMRASTKEHEKPVGADARDKRKRSSRSKNERSDPRAADILAFGKFTVRLIELIAKVDAAVLEEPCSPCSPDRSRPQSARSNPSSARRRKDAGGSVVTQVEDQGLRLMILRCMEADASHRMSASMVVRMLRLHSSGDVAGCLEAIPGDMSKNAPLID